MHAIALIHGDLCMCHQLRRELGFCKAKHHTIQQSTSNTQCIFAPHHKATFHKASCLQQGNNDRIGNQALHTENSMHDLSWTRALGSGIWSICFWTLPLSPVRMDCTQQSVRLQAGSNPRSQSWTYVSCSRAFRPECLAQDPKWFHQTNDR